MSSGARTTAFGRLRRAAASVCAAAVLAGCPVQDDRPEDYVDPAARRAPALKFPAVRLPRDQEAAVMELLDQFRGVDTDYLGRIKAEEALDRRIREGETRIVGYLTQLLDDPLWDVRAATFRLLVRHGRTDREAVSALVQALGDTSVNAAVRDAAARALRSWTGLDLPYDAWGDDDAVRAAAARWNEWLAKTGGAIAAPEP